LTEKIADASVAWGRFPGADVYLRRHIHQIRTRNPDVGRPMADGVSQFRMAGVAYLRSKPRRMANVNLSAQGGACYTVLDDTVSWQDRLKQVTAAMVALPENTDLAFVQYSPAYTISWMDLQSVRPPLPYVEEPVIRYNRHLYSRYTPDAHGLQLLTDAHLEHANDQSDWVIEPLGGGRHLVRAKDLQPWYANIDPDPDTLAKARADFGKLIPPSRPSRTTRPPGTHREPQLDGNGVSIGHGHRGANDVSCFCLQGSHRRVHPGKALSLSAPRPKLDICSKAAQARTPPGP